jgi:hypothetical protein
VIQIDFNVNAIEDHLNNFSEKAKTSVIRVGSQAAAQVFYDEAKSRVPAKSGTLRDSIYQVFSQDNSSASKVTYHVRLRNQFKAQQKTNEASFDKMWKVVQQQSGVATTERETFKKAYSEIMSSTKGVVGEGKLASFFTQAKIDINSDLFAKLMNSIESQRESFHQDQKTLLQIKKQHDDVLQTFPGSLILAGRPELEVVVITSEKTEEVFSKGKEDDVDLFPKK